MRIKEKTLTSVLANNDRFKSRFETNTSNGLLDLQARRIAEKEYLGNYNHGLAGEHRMIYGYIAKKEAFFGEYDRRFRKRVLHSYGDVIIIFKDYIKRRTSFTACDSARFPYLRAVPLEKPNGDCFPLLSPQKATDEIRRLGLSSFIDLYNPLKQFNEFLPYIEAQIHYGAHPNNIEKIILTGPSSKYEALIQLLEKRKITFEISADDPIF